MLFFKIVGIAGLLLICIGLILKKRKNEDELYIVGGIFLLFYSLYIKDIIFIILQIIFILFAVYDLLRIKIKK